jgi:hypothetical protein
MFVSDIEFTKGSFRPVQLTLSEGDGWAMLGDSLSFGWVANPVRGVASETITVPGLPDGDYDIHFYRTWRGA